MPEVLGRRPPSSSARPYDLAQSADQLLALIRDSLARGHSRVALQRCFMLQRLGAGLPDDLAHLVAEGVARRQLREIRRMKRAAEDWAAMLRIRA